MRYYPACSRLTLTLIVTATLFAFGVTTNASEEQNSPTAEATSETTGEHHPAELNTPSLNTRVEVFPPLLPLAEPAVVEPPSLPLAVPLAPPPMRVLDVMLDWYLSPQHAALIVAEAKGLYALQGLDVHLHTPADPSLPIKLLSNGEVDLALTRQPLLHLYAHEGAPIVRIGTLIETPLTAVIVADDRDTLPGDALFGLRYGFTTREGRDIVIPALVPEALQQIDDYIPPENVHFEAGQALGDERLDAIADALYPILPEQLANEGIANHVVTLSELGIPVHDGLIVLGNSDATGRQADTWARFMIAIEEASQWIVEHPQKAWELMVATHPVLDTPTNTQAWDDILHRMALAPAAVDTRRYQRFEDYLVDAGIVDDALSVSRLAIDPHAR